MVAVNKVIIDYGHTLTVGWAYILEIIAKTRDQKSLDAII